MLLKENLIAVPLPVLINECLNGIELGLLSYYEQSLGFFPLYDFIQGRKGEIILAEVSEGVKVASRVVSKLDHSYLTPLAVEIVCILVLEVSYLLLKLRKDHRSHGNHHQEDQAHHAVQVKQGTRGCPLVEALLEVSNGGIYGLYRTASGGACRADTSVFHLRRAREGGSVEVHQFILYPIIHSNTHDGGFLLQVPQFICAGTSV